MSASLIAFGCIQVVITIIVVSFNLLSIHLLRKPNTYEYSQKICLLQLSVIKVLFLLAQNIPFFFDLNGVDQEVTSHVWLLIFCALVVPWCNIMFVLTTDHFIQVLLNTQQQAFYLNTRNTTRFVLVLCWFVGAMCYIAIMLTKDFFRINSLRIIHLYVIQIYHVVIVATFLCTYLCIICRSKQQKWKLSEYVSDIDHNINDTTKRDSSNATKNLMQTFLTTRKMMRENLMPIFIAISYTLFVMIPEFLHYSMFHGDHAPNNNTIMSVASMILFDCAGLAECLLHIFLNASTKKAFFHLISCEMRRRKFSTVINLRHEIKLV